MFADLFDISICDSEIPNDHLTGFALGDSPKNMEITL